MGEREIKKGKGKWGRVKGEVGLMVPMESCMVQTLSNLWLALTVLTNYHTRRPIPAGRSVS
ncbi:MAG: hypothetical protein QOH96_1294 [Blastocatellia bacterium]|nr:hypothetical protein [Blastocatellia bacterium]